MKKYFLLVAVFFISIVMIGCEKTNSPAPPTEDKTPPIIISASPDDGPTDVDTKASIILTFSKKMDTSSVKDAFSINPSVNGTFKWSNGDTVMTYTPDSELAPGTLYTCLITPTAKDIAKNALENQIEWSWTTIVAQLPSKMPVSSKLPPPIQFAAPPDLVVVPETDVYVVPDSQEDIYFEQGWWWRNWNGHWYRSRSYDRGWGYYSGYPSWHRKIPSDWRNNYKNHMWGGRPWNPNYIHNSELDKHWSGGHWRDDNGWGNKGDFQGQGQQGLKGTTHGQQGFQGHSQQGLQGQQGQKGTTHGQQGFQGHSQQGLQGQQGLKGTTHSQQGLQGQQQRQPQAQQQKQVQQQRQPQVQQQRQPQVQQQRQPQVQQQRQPQVQQQRQPQVQQQRQPQVQQQRQPQVQQQRQPQVQQQRQPQVQQQRQPQVQQQMQPQVQQGQKGTTHGQQGGDPRVKRCGPDGKPEGCKK